MTEAAPQTLEGLLGAALGPMALSMVRSRDEVVVEIGRTNIREACRRAKLDPSLDVDYLRCLSGVDYPDRFEVVYHLYSTRKRHRVVFKVRLPKENPTVDSVTQVWRGANWHEREATDMFGIRFTGHPDPRTLLLMEGQEDHPLLKSFRLAELRKTY